MAPTGTMGRRRAAIGAFVAAAALAAPGANAGEDLATLLSPATGRAWFVSAEGGNNQNDGSRKSPFKEIDRALKSAAAGDTILVAEGRYMGTFGIGYLEIDKPVRLYGGFSGDFSSRDHKRRATRFQPDNASGAKARKPLITFTKGIDGAVLDGFVLDMGERNSYSAAEGKPDGVATGMLLLPPAKNGNDAPTVEQPILSVATSAEGGNFTVRNCVFANGANFGIQAAIRSGTMTVENNVFVANRMAAIEAYATSNADPAATVVVRNNTILFTWSRLKDFADMGYGIRIMKKTAYDIQGNLIGGNVTGGIDHTRFNKDDSIRMDGNVFFVNRRSDLFYSPSSNTQLSLRTADFGDLPFASAKDNRTEIPPSLAIDKAYLAGFLAARYTEETDLDRDSPANQWRSVLGMPLQGTMTSAATMFANRYPWESALGMFGAVPGAGAQ